MTDLMSAMEVQMEKQVLKYAVQRLIFCPACERVMDMRKVASMTFTQPETGEVVHTVVLCVSCFDATKERIAATLKIARGTSITLTVVDARDLYRTRTKAASK